jgi:FkbM family methyltransferase
MARTSKECLKYFVATMADSQLWGDRLKMDYLSMISRLDTVAAVLRKLGLQRITRAGRHALGKALASSLQVEWERFQVHGSIEHRGYLHALGEGRHEAFATELFKQSIQPGMTVLDIGAYLGEYALIAARAVGSGGKVYAFEPDPRNFEKLLQNIVVNGYTDIIIPIQKAVSDRAGSSSFFLQDADPSNNSLFQPPGVSKRVTAECVVLDDFFLEGNGFDIVKVDIEGAELNALLGMKSILSNTNGKITMFVECNPSALNAAEKSAQDLILFLRDLGFDIHLIDESNRRVASLNIDSNWSKYANLHCIRG